MWDWSDYDAETLMKIKKHFDGLEDLGFHQDEDMTYSLQQELEKRILHSLQEKAHEIIDMVEEAIRDEFPQVDKIARDRVVDGEKPNTLLYGEAYYDLENQLAETIRNK